MIKQLLLSLIFASGLSQLCLAQEVKTVNINGEEVKVYENFLLVHNAGAEKLNADKGIKNSPDTITSLKSNITAVKASGNDGSNIALVIPENKWPYVIKAGIHYKCKKDVADCIPARINAQRIGTSNLYKAEANNFDQWLRVMTVLRESSNVTKILPGYDYGTKKVIK